MKYILVGLLLLLTTQSQAAILVFSPNGTYTTKLTLEEARAAADVAGKTVVVTSALSAAQSNLTAAWPPDRSLQVEIGGSIGNTTAITINGPFSAPLAPVFTGIGTVAFGVNSTPYRPSIWGSATFAAGAELQKTTGDNSAGILDWTHNGDGAYLLHLKTGASYAGQSFGGFAVGPPAMIGVGVGDGGANYGIGMHMNNKKSGTCLEILNQPYATAGGRGFHGMQYSNFGPFMQLDASAGGDLLNMAGSNGATFPTRSLLRITDDYGGDVNDGYEIFNIKSTTGNTEIRGGLKVIRRPLEVTTAEAIPTNKVIINPLTFNMYHWTGGATNYYPFKITTGEDDPTEIAIKTGVSAAIGAETYDKTVLRGKRDVTTGEAAVGFLGATPVVRQTATDLATVITALRNLGLIN
jgi:hypothetical protein